jgi:ferredoxin-type protein NapG
MRRRTIMRRIVYGIGLIFSGLAPFILSRLQSPVLADDSRRRLQPPGALQSAKEFSAACIGCGLCGEVCPPRCIQFHKRDGGREVNLPYIDPVQKGCILCNKCIDVCPTDALTPIERDGINMGLAEIDRTACYPWVDRGVCGACVSICPLGDRAIAYEMWNQYRPVILDGCVGCGLCVEVCPHPSLPIWINNSILSANA